jgi:hypothetical protein
MEKTAPSKPGIKHLEGYNRIFVHDPFGNRIELLEVVPSSS